MHAVLVKTPHFRRTPPVHTVHRAPVSAQSPAARATRLPPGRVSASKVGALSLATPLQRWGALGFPFGVKEVRWFQAPYLEWRWSLYNYIIREWWSKWWSVGSKRSSGVEMVNRTALQTTREKKYKGVGGCFVQFSALFAQPCTCPSEGAFQIELRCDTRPAAALPPRLTVLW